MCVKQNPILTAFNFPTQNTQQAKNERLLIGHEKTVKNKNKKQNKTKQQLQQNPGRACLC